MVIAAASAEALHVIATARSRAFTAEGHEWRPETASLPWSATSTGWLYQPFESAVRAGAADTFGGVASYWKERVLAAEMLPAASVQVPVTEADPESGPEYVTAVH